MDTGINEMQVVEWKPSYHLLARPSGQDRGTKFNIDLVDKKNADKTTTRHRHLDKRLR